jgi:antitoxin VapB
MPVRLSGKDIVKALGKVGWELERVTGSCMAEVCYLIYTSSMALSIKSDEADQLARELAAETGETLTEAVVIALRERLDREHARHAASMRTRLARLAADVAALPVADTRAPEEIIGYDDAGLPR